MERQRIHWIDMLKGICMMLILLFHTEIYYNGSEIIDYNLYVCDALIIFFFLSGYHFYKPHTFSKGHDIRLKNFKDNIRKIIRKIILPYFMFTSVIAFPKAVAYGTSTEFAEIFIRIISGNASWFVAALATAEIMFSLILYICKEKTMILSISAIITFCISIYTSVIKINLWWQLENAFMAFSFLYLGYFFHKKENTFNRFNNIYYTSFLLLILIITKIYVEKTGISLLIEPIIINNIPIFILDAITVILFMVNITKQLPGNKIIEWTGSHSIVYYFMCGGVPFIVSKILCKIGLGYNGQYYMMIMAFILVYIIISAITWIIYRYIPFVTGNWTSKKYI